MLLKRNLLSSFATQIPLLILGICAGAFLTRLIGPTGTGIMAVFQSDIELFVMLFSFSFNNAIVFYMANKKLSFDQLTAISIATLLLGSILLILLFALIHLFDLYSLVYPHAYMSGLYQGYLFLSFVFFTTNSFISSFFQGRQEFVVINKIAIGNSVLNFLSYAIFFLLYKWNIVNVTVNVVLIYSIVLLLLNTAIWILLFRLKFGPVQFQTGFYNNIKPVWRFILHIYLSNVLNFFNYRLDIWIINHYCRIEELGYYSKAVNVSQFLLLISNPLALVLMPYLSSLGQNENLEIKLMRIARINFTTVFVFGCILFFLSDYLFPALYGTAFIQSIVPFKLLIIGVLFTCSTKIYSTFIFSQGKVKYNLIATLLALISTIVMDLVLIPVYGIAGAAFASGITYFIVHAIVFAFILRIFKFGWGNYFIMQRDDFKALFSMIGK